METHRDIINLWRKSSHLAREIGVHLDAVRSWKCRNSIPAEHWLAVQTAASNAGHPVTLHLLARTCTRMRGK